MVLGEEVSLAACKNCGAGIETADQVQQREDDDPNNVDEMPIQSEEFDIQGGFGAQASFGSEDGHGHEPDDSQCHVGAMEAGEGEEGGPKQVATQCQSLVLERVEFKDLEPDKDRSQKCRGQ